MIELTQTLLGLLMLGMYLFGFLCGGLVAYQIGHSRGKREADEDQKKARRVVTRLILGKDGRYHT